MSTPTTISALGHSVGEPLSASDGEAILQRTCFGHLAVAHEGSVDVVPVRYACIGKWVYFRASPELRDVIAHHPWVTMSVTELRDHTHVRSVIVRGGCYATEDTGSPAGDATAMLGIIALRDRPTVGRSRGAHVVRTSTVFRLHVSELSGHTVSAPCPAGDREYDERELQQLRESSRTQTGGEDERADDDGMAAADPQRAAGLDGLT